MQDRFLRLAIRGLQILPEEFARGLACLVGWFLSEILRSRRRIIEQNLQIAFGDRLTHEEVVHIRQQSWINLILTGMEMLRFPRHKERYLDMLSVVGFDEIATSLSAGHGVIFVSAHMGNWEIAASYLAQQAPFAVIARPLNQKGAGQILDEIRREMGVTVFPRKSALRSVLAFLRRGGMVAFMLDQHASKHSVVVPFFDRPAKTFSSAAALALRTGAAVHLGYVRRKIDRSLCFEISPAFPHPDSGDFDRDVWEATAEYTRAIEDAIRSHPESWLWMHRRWRKIRPDNATTTGHEKSPLT